MKEQLELRPYRFNETYAKKWNVGRQDDYLRIYRNGELVSDSVYRIGGLGGDFEDGYAMLLKYVEEYYGDNITKVKKDKPHLAGHWCIIDEEGNEKVVVDQFKSPCLRGGIIYSMDNNFYNIETGELICEGRDSMDSGEFLFVNNPYDKDESKRGVWKVNKVTGDVEIFRERKRERRKIKIRGRNRRQSTKNPTF